ncbi:MAG: CapA family protein [Clostridiales bacterium]|nr:CapA family protein [Clostridiales bacterium]
MKTTLIATGDSFTTRRIPMQYPGRQELKTLLEKHDVRFNNLEMTYHRREGYPAAFSGGTWAMADPAILDDMNEMGFNLYNTANNHSGDYSHGGILATIRNLKERNMVFAGTGENMYEASRAAYLETAECRVALIAVTADFHDSDLAGDQGPALMGRPGVNGLRVNTVYHVTEDYYHTLQKLVTETNLNYYDEYGMKLGYVIPAPKDQLSMKGMKFHLSDHVAIETAPGKTDMKRVEDEIREARRQADYVMVSVHSHDGHPRNYIDPPEYLETFSRNCIDAGADVILGHGPHELRAIEIYHGKPIFYSLGNFIFQTETIACQPAEAYQNKGLSADKKVGEYMDERSAHGTRGYGIMESIWFSVLPSWEVEDGRVREISLYPITLDPALPRSRKGLPRLFEDDRVLEHLQQLSGQYGTKIEIRNHVGIIHINE